jgi:hypothetical protein
MATNPHAAVARPAEPERDPATEREELRTMANEGFNAWLSSLPADDWTDILDESAGVSVRWVDGVGFVETEG